MVCLYTKFVIFSYSIHSNNKIWKIFLKIIRVICRQMKDSIKIERTWCTFHHFNKLLFNNFKREKNNFQRIYLF